jgi:hypothetical protein
MQKRLDNPTKENDQLKKFGNLSMKGKVIEFVEEFIEAATYLKISEQLLCSFFCAKLQ